MKLKRTTKLLIVGCIVGLAAMLYPTVSNYWNDTHATQAITDYVESVEGVESGEYRELWLSAVEYNERLAERGSGFAVAPSLRERYADELNIAGSGILGYVELAKLGVSLPIYHGVSEGVLQVAVGHLDWSSLPTGGVSTHCVVSGHRGLPSAKLFTDLDDLREGDIFELVVLGETLTYEVDQIRTVVPDDTDTLQITKGKDYCTLVTCTPYGINTHRLLVRGHRIENLVKSARVVSEAVVIDPLIVAPIVAFPLLFTLVMMVILKKPEHRPPKKRRNT